jgi:hypothetical protein
MPDYERSRKVWHDHLLRWGGVSAVSARMVRANVERPMVMAMSQYTPRELASIRIDNAVRFVVSAWQVDPADYVDKDRDNIRFNGKEYRIVMDPSGQQPDGTWIAWDCMCSFVKDI